MPNHSMFRNPLAEFTLWLVWTLAALPILTGRFAQRVGRRVVQWWGDLVRSRFGVDPLETCLIVLAMASLLVWAVIATVESS